MEEKKHDPKQRQLEDKDLENVSGGFEKIEGPTDSRPSEGPQPTKIDHRIG
jgi:hypothetical protein